MDISEIKSAQSHLTREIFLDQVGKAGAEVNQTGEVTTPGIPGEVIEIDTAEISETAKILDMVKNAESPSRQEYIDSLKEAFNSGTLEAAGTDLLVEAMIADGTAELF